MIFELFVWLLNSFEKNWVISNFYSPDGFNSILFCSLIEIVLSISSKFEAFQNAKNVPSYLLADRRSN